MTSGEKEKEKKSIPTERITLVASRTVNMKERGCMYILVDGHGMRAILNKVSLKVMERKLFLHFLVNTSRKVTFIATNSKAGENCPGLVSISRSD